MDRTAAPIPPRARRRDTWQGWTPRPCNASMARVRGDQPGNRWRQEWGSMPALGSSDTLCLRTANRTLVLARISCWTPGDLGRVSGRDAAGLFDSLWLDQSALDELRRFWARQ